MSHKFQFSILGTHIKNAEREVTCIKSVEGLMKVDLNYGEKEKRIFEENIQHGVLAIYSINAALETVVAMLSKELNLGVDKFYTRIKILKSKGIITNDDDLERCLDLRGKRNTITHWEQDGKTSLGSIGHIQFMMGNKEPKGDIEQLVSILTKENLEEYFKSFNNLFDNIMENIKNKNDILDRLTIFREGYSEIGY